MIFNLQKEQKRRKFKVLNKEGVINNEKISNIYFKFRPNVYFCKFCKGRDGPQPDE